MLNREAPVNPKTDDQEDGVHDKVEEIAVNKRTNLGEVKAVIKGLQHGKVLGIDSITAELLKADILFS